MKQPNNQTLFHYSTIIFYIYRFSFYIKKKQGGGIPGKVSLFPGKMKKDIPGNPGKKSYTLR